MNKTLSALKTKLLWQIQELDQQALRINQALKQLREELLTLRQTVQQACLTPAHLLPEQEVSRLNFMVLKQHEEDQLLIKMKELVAQEDAILLKKLRLDTEMAMLGKHEENQRQAKRKEKSTREQNALDEWVLQQGEPA